jgi:hypothetical protein
MTYLDLLDIEPQVAAGLASILETATGITAISTYDTSAKTTPRIEVAINLGAVTKHLGFDGDGNPLPDSWEATFRFSVVTARLKSQSPSTIRAKIRLACLAFQQLFTTDSLPNHEIPILWEAGTSEGISESDDEDVAEMMYSGQIHIRPEVLATVSDALTYLRPDGASIFRPDGASLYLQP